MPHQEEEKGEFSSGGNTIQLFLKHAYYGVENAGSNQIGSHSF